MILKSIFRKGNANLPGDFGVYVSKNNIAAYTEKQKIELEKYLAHKGIKQKIKPDDN